MFVEMLAVVGGLAAAGLSARWNWWRRPGAGIPVLMYHKVGDPPPGSTLKKLWVSKDQLRWQMGALRRWGYQPVTLRHALRGPLPEKPVVITFDDGYKNNLDQGLPVLREFGFPAVIFIVVNAVGRDNFWHDPKNEVRIPMLSWDEVRTLRDAGWEIGSHTLTHPRLLRLSPEEARRELEESRKRLGDQLGEPPVSFAHPYGNGADDIPLRRLVEEAGYRAACSVHQGLADIKKAPLCLNRIFVRGDDTRFDFYLNLTRGRARF